MIYPGPDAVSRSRCGHAGCADSVEDVWLTLPNLITASRLVVTLAFCTVAMGATSPQPALVAALASYWVGDIADGLIARRTHAETRTGALLDILADRLSVTMIVLLYTVEHPVVRVPASVFLFQFAFVDAYLTVTFLNWSLLSPNYFYLIDRSIHRWNWSPPAKVINSCSVIGAWLITRSPVVATLVALTLVVGKAASLLAMRRNTPPMNRSGCACQDRRTALAASAAS